MKDLRIYVISLAKNNPRRVGLKKVLTQLGGPHEIVDAVDGRDGLSTTVERELDRAEANRRARRQVTDAELACSLSHRIAWERFLRSDGEWALVLEDDAILDARIGRFLAAGSYRAAPMLLLHHRNARVLGRGSIIAGTESRLEALACSPWRSTAYTINRPVALRLIEEQSPVRSLADWPIDIASVGAQALVPEIVGHPPQGAASSVLEIDRRKSIARQLPNLSRMLTFAYWRRKWIKLRAKKVS